MDVLTEEDLRMRLRVEGASALLVTPISPGSIRGAGLNVRLGNRFTVFQPTTARFDTPNPGLMPVLMEKAWGDNFYLPPGERVIASILEYVMVPSDLTAHLVTKSSHGRLGLISPTAVQVPPLFAGHLTFELVNLGQMTLAITPGEWIAQLVFMTTNRPA